MINKCIVLFTLSFITLLFEANFTSTQKILLPDELCLQCICEMATGCNLTLGCDEQGLCGPFRMTKPYWIDAGKPVLYLDDQERPGAFVRCATDPVCASEAVKAYAGRYGQDCNDDKEINCMDYARIHQFGYGPFCRTPLFGLQLANLNKCLTKSKV